MSAYFDHARICEAWADRTEETRLALRQWFEGPNSPPEDQFTPTQLRAVNTARDALAQAAHALYQVAAGFQCAPVNRPAAAAYQAREPVSDRSTDPAAVAVQDAFGWDRWTAERHVQQRRVLAARGGR